MQDMIRRIQQLQENVQRAQTLRAQAEGSLTAAKDQYAAHEQQLRDLGIDPAKAEEELKAMEQQLDVAVTEAEQQVTTAIQEYTTIIEQVQKATADAKATS